MMDLPTKVSGRFPKTTLIRRCVKDMVSNVGWMALYMKAGSKKIKPQAWAVLFMQMLISMRESGRTIKQRAMGPTLVRMALNM